MTSARTRVGHCLRPRPPACGACEPFLMVNMYVSPLGSASLENPDECALPFSLTPPVLLCAWLSLLYIPQDQALTSSHLDGRQTAQMTSLCPSSPPAHPAPAAAEQTSDVLIRMSVFLYFDFLKSSLKYIFLLLEREEGREGNIDQLPSACAPTGA